MADDLKLQAVISAVLDSKGFDEAKVALQGLVDKTNLSSPAFENAAKGTKEFSRELGGTRGPAADLTRILLQNIGVTGAAGQAAKTAGTAFSVLGGAASATSLGLVGLVTVAAFLIPKLIEWATATDDTAAATKKLQEGIAGLLPELEDYVVNVRGAHQELRTLYDQLARKEMEKQAEDIAALDKAIAKDTAEMQRYSAGIAEVTEELKARGGGERIITQTTEAYRKKVVELTAAIKENTTARDALLVAQAAGVPLNKLLASSTASAIKTERESAKVAEERKRKAKEYADFVKAFQRQQVIDAKMDMARMSAMTKAEAAEYRKRLETEAAYYDAERDFTRERMAQDVVYQANKRAAWLETTQQSISALGAIFGKTKEAAIAQAIIDTYSAAAAAIRPPNPPLPWSAPFLALALATGFAQVANIRKQGFDDPVNDLMAARLGHKFAQDFVSLVQGGFASGIRGAMGGGGGGASYTTINRGTTIQGGVHLGGFFGTNETEMMKRLNRKLIEINRLETRTKI